SQAPCARPHSMRPAARLNFASRFGRCLPVSLLLCSTEMPGDGVGARRGTLGFVGPVLRRTANLEVACRLAEVAPMVERSPARKAVRLKASATQPDSDNALPGKIAEEEVSFAE